MNRGLIPFVVIAVFVSVGLIGCTGSRVSMNPGARNLVERTPEKKPKWADWGETYKQEKDKFLFIGEVKDRADFSMAITEAGIVATKIAGYQLARELNMSLQSSAAGRNVGNEMGQDIRDLFIQEAKNLRIMGLVQRERFVETWDVGTVGGQKRVYHAWALMEISEEDYLASKQNLLDRAAGRARESRDLRAQKLLDEFRAEVKKEAQ